ncbi:MAG TPA: D-2-hydroxyacid dehydrogenase [Levilinea sp.]|nr:D-2-hydroxyacid dehydrogenase [Levilinea sp.]
MSIIPVEVLITIPFSEGQLERLRAVSLRVTLTLIPVRRAEDIAADAWRRAEVFYTGGMLPDPGKVELPNLRWVQFHFSGVDGVLDAPIFKRDDITFTNLSGAAAAQMAEYLMTMMLALGHKLPAMTDFQNRAEWPRDRFERFTPRELRGSTVGIVGYGSIGRELARLLQPFGVKVLAAKKDVRQPKDTGYVPEGQGDPDGALFHRLYPIEALKSMLKECDFIVVAVPLTAETQNLIGDEELRAMKSTAYIVDVSRGGIINPKALLSALQDNRIAGAALDVFYEEPLPSNSPFWKLKNAIITPHIAGQSTYYNDRAIELFIENLERYLQGEALLNRIDPHKGY